MKYPPSLNKLIILLKKLPGVGGKSAERFAFNMIDWSDELLEELSQTIGKIKKDLIFCHVCGCLIQENPCQFCKADSSQLCIVATFKDVFTIEAMKEYKGGYHVIGGLLSPIRDQEIDVDRIRYLKKQIRDKNIKEIIIALEPTLEGDATTLFLKQHALDEFPYLSLSQLALGIPVGSNFDFVDPSTLARAFQGRTSYK